MSEDDAKPKAGRLTREQTTSRILDAAEELFATRNPRDVTVREIAEKAGVTHPLVHQYVGTKEDLVNAVLMRVATDRTALVKGSATLDQAIQILVEQVLTNRVHSKALVRSAMDGVDYPSLGLRIPTGEALIKLARQDAAGHTAYMMPPSDIDARVVLAAISSMAYGWAATEKLTLPAFGLETYEKEDIHRQLGEIVAYLQNLIHENRA